MALAGEVKAGLAAAAATLAVGLLALNQVLVGVFYDDGLYAGLATALASGLGYVHPNLPGLPGAVHYPPLYPVVLTPIFGVLSVHGAATVAKVLYALLGAGAAGLIAWHATRINRDFPSGSGAGCRPRSCLRRLSRFSSAYPDRLFAEPLFAVLLAVAVIAGSAEIAVDRRTAGSLAL